MSMPALGGSARTIPLPKILAAMLFPLFMGLAYPASYMSSMVDPSPHHMEVEVIASTDQSEQLAQQLRVNGGDALEVTTVADAATAKADVLDLDARAAYDPATGDLYVASAGGRQATSAATNIFQKVADEQGTELAVQDLQAPAEADSLGVGYMYVVVASLIGGYITATMLGNVASGSRMRVKLAVLGIMAVVAGVLTAGIDYGLLGVFDHHLVLAALVSGATFLTSGVVMLGMSSLIGMPATLIGITLFVILGIPTTGIAVTADLLPGFFRVLHRMLPSGASGELMRRVLYFDGAGSGPWIMLLITWLMLGAGMLWASTLRAPGRHDGVVSEGVEHARRHPGEPLLTAYESEEGEPAGSPTAPPRPPSTTVAPENAPASAPEPTTARTAEEADSGLFGARHRAQEEGLA